jgi:hypothetical protein
MQTDVHVKILVLFASSATATWPWPLAVNKLYFHCVCSFICLQRKVHFYCPVNTYLHTYIQLGICVAPIQPFRAALGTESRVCYPGNTADRLTQWALTYYHLSQSTANQNGKLFHCHRWYSNSWSSGCWRTSLTTWLSPTPFECYNCIVLCMVQWSQCHMLVTVHFPVPTLKCY